MSRIDELTDRIERLLLRHEELRRTNALLQQQLAVTGQERDSLRARLSAARARIDALIDKLPPSGVDAEAEDATPQADNQSGHP
jgi:cell division protein ZapB